MIPDTTQGRHTWPWQGGGEWQDKKVGYFAVENLATIWSLQTFLGHLFICINKKRHCVKKGQKIIYLLNRRHGTEEGFWRQ